MLALRKTCLVFVIITAR